MSCLIKQIASIPNTIKIRDFLFATEATAVSDNWLQSCEVALSPIGETMVFGYKSRVVVVAASWNTNDSITQFGIDYCDYITEEEDAIKSILCLPVVGHSHSSKVGPDWICIAVGFESGFVRFYTETCQLLHEEQYHNAAVCSLKCQSQHSPRPDVNSDLKPEEMYVHYASNVCILNGAQLFALLRNRRNLLHSNARGSEELATASTNLRKWGFQDQFAIDDAAVVGLDLANTFDHLLTASVCGGYDTKYRAMPPNNSLVVSAGASPFVGFHYALEGGPQPVFSDVTKAVASKLMSALPGWLTKGRSQVEKQTSLALTPVETMACRFGICDAQRIATTVILSPDKRLAVTTDVLGRISLIDTHRGVLIRMLKGYRDAQCAFVQVPDERRAKHKAYTRVALFLIVYSPKKGTIEIFSAPMCLRIATFSASKFSRLIYISYGLFGFTVTKKSKYVCQFTCILMEADGVIKDFLIPFHFALTEKNSKRVRDLHLYKRLKGFIKSGEYTDDALQSECLNTCKELKTSEICLQTLEMMIGCKEMTVAAVLECTKYFREKISELNRSEFDSYVEILIVLAENLQVLCNFFLFLSRDEENGNTCAQDKGGSTSMCLGDEEVGNLQKLLDLSTDNDNNETHVKVSFKEDELKLSDYLAAFDLTSISEIVLKPNIDSAILLNLSSCIFKSHINGQRSDFPQLKEELAKIKLPKADLFEMVLNYWVTGPLSVNIKLESEMDNLGNLIYILSHIGKEVQVEYNEISTFWETIREKLANSARPFPALTAALICRAVAQRIEREKELQQRGAGAQEEEESFEIWEKMSQENCKWSLLIGKLEDISLLNIILSKRPMCCNTDLFTLPKLRHDPTDISLRYVLEKGKGIISELVARWLTTIGINLRNLIEHDENNSEDKNGKNVTIEPYFQYLELLKKQFPHSLDANILLANVCWEYALHWKKNAHEFACLEAAICCLNSIPNPHVRQGLSNLVWNAHLKIIFEGCSKLINKVGKLPKEKLCKQDTGFTDFQIRLFIEICTEFLDKLMDTVEVSYNWERMHVNYENIWENGGGHSLADLILQHDYINYDLLHAHLQLSLLLQMIVTFNIKHTKPINNLFDTMTVSLFFSDLQQRVPLNWHTSDAKMAASRIQLLLKVIAATIETITHNNEQIYAAEHVKWMGKIICLTRVWNLEFDVLRQYQITELYANGFDSLAQELLPTVSDRRKLGPELLSIAGKRLKQYIASSQDLGAVIATMSPTLSQFIDNLDSNWCAPTTLESILCLTTQCLACLEEDSTQHKVAVQLYDALENLNR